MQATSITARSFGKLQHMSRPLLHIAAAVSEPTMDNSGSQSAANIARASGKLGHAGAAATHAASRRAMQLAPKPSAQQLSNIIWYPGTLKIEDGRLVDVAARGTCEKIQEPAPQNTSNTVRNPGTPVQKHGRATSACTFRSKYTLDGLGQQEPANTLWKLAALEWLGMLPTEAAAKRLASIWHTVALQGLANIAWAFLGSC